jgi:hypothetical protein
MGGYTGHDHFWQRALSRRSFVAGGAAAAGGAALGIGVLRPGAALAEDARANPILGGLAPPLMHANLNTYTSTDPLAFDDQATVTDFVGVIGSSHLNGTGTGQDAILGERQFGVDVDMRFQKGTYVGVDGVARQATFGFI